MRFPIAALILASAMGFRAAPAAHAIVPIDSLAADVAAGLAFAPGDSLLVAGLADGALVWWFGDDSPPRRVALPAGRRATAIAATAEYLLIADSGGMVHVRRLADGDSVRTISARRTIADIALAPDGTAVVAACPSIAAGQVIAWRIADGVEILRTDLAVAPIAIDWTRDGRTLVCAATGNSISGDRILLLDAQNGSTVQEIRRNRHLLTGHAGTVAATSDGIYLAAADDAVGLWNRADGAPVRSFGTGEPDPEGIALSADGRWLAAAGTRHGFSLWEVDTGTRIHHVPGDSASLHAVAISVDGRHVATGGAAGIVLWRVDPPFRPPGTPVAGTIVSATWPAAASPYRVVGDIVVPPGETLTVAPGVDVLFDVDARIAVEGRLVAVGTAADSIRFLPGTAREWGGIRISGGDSSAIACARIDGAYPGNPGGTESGGGLAIIGPRTRIGLAGVVLAGNASNIDGGGLSLVDTACATLHSCTVKANRAGSNGGGLHARRSAIVLADCLIAGNAAGGNGGGIAIEGAGADAASGGSSLVGCRITNNAAQFGGGALLARNTAIAAERCLFAGNGAETNGAAVCVFSTSGRTTSLALTACTVAGNRVNAGGNAILVQDAALSVAGSIVWDDPPFALAGSGTLAVRYSNVAGAYLPVGTGNFSADPQFADTAAGDFTLGRDSPCIDTGDPARPADPDGSRADAGAFPYAHPVAIARADGPSALALAPPAPNPCNPSTTIRFTLPAAGGIRLTVHDLSGRSVRTLADDRMTAGPHGLIWDGRDSAGRPCASGVYLARLVATEGTRVRRMVLVR